MPKEEEHFYLTALETLTEHKTAEDKQNACVEAKNYSCAQYWKEEARALFGRAKENFQRAEVEHKSFASLYFRVRESSRYLLLAIQGRSLPKREREVLLLQQELTRRVQDKFRTAEAP